MGSGNAQDYRLSSVVTRVLYICKTVPRVKFTPTVNFIGCVERLKLSDSTDYFEHPNYVSHDYNHEMAWVR